MRQLSSELIECARKRLATPVDSITESDIRRAQSDLYYAVFHAVCGVLVEPFSKAETSKAFNRIFVAIYRYPAHRTMEERARLVPSNTDFPNPIKNLAKSFVDLKNKREEADYNPLSVHDVSIIRNDLQKIETVLDQFWALSEEVRIGFALYLTKLEKR